MKVSTRRIRSERHLRLAVLVAAVIAIDARAELVEIAWDKAGRFETTVSVAPGKFAAHGHAHVPDAHHAHEH